MSRWNRVVALTTFVCLVGVSSVQASLVLKLDSPVGLPAELIMADNLGAGVLTSGGLLTTIADLNPNLGAVFFSGSVGSFPVSINALSSKPVLSPAHINLFSVLITTQGPGTVEIMTTDTNFTTTGNSTVKQDISGFLTAPAGSSLTATGFADGGNSEFGMLYPTPPLVFGPGAIPPFLGIGSSTGAAPALANPFSLSGIVRVVFTGAGSVAFSHDVETITAVPEPGSLFVWLSCCFSALVAWKLLPTVLSAVS